MQRASQKLSNRFILLSLAFVLVLALVLAVGIGSVPIPAKEVVSIVLSGLRAIFSSGTQWGRARSHSLESALAADILGSVCGCLSGHGRRHDAGIIA